MWLLIFVLDSNTEQCQGSAFSVTPLLEILLGEPGTQPVLIGTQNSYVESRLPPPSTQSYPTPPCDRLTRSGYF